MTIVPFDQYPFPQDIPLRVAAIDVGSDLRRNHLMVTVRQDARVASYDDAKGNRWVVTGTPADIITALTRAGYNAQLDPIGIAP